MHYLTRVIIICVVICAALTSYAQKKKLDFIAYESWPDIKDPKISNDGKYCLYTITSKSGTPSLVIRSVNNSFFTELSGVTKAMFTQDSKRVVFPFMNDSLGIFNLNTNSLELISDVASFKIPEKGNGQWLGYTTGEVPSLFVLKNLVSNKEERFLDIVDFQFTKDGNALILITASELNGRSTKTLFWRDFNNGSIRKIWSGDNLVSLNIDENGSQLAFTAEQEVDGELQNKINYYKRGMDSVQSLVAPTTPGMQGLLVNNNALAFSSNGQYLFFKVQKVSDVREFNRPDTGAQVIIWAYTDDVLNKRKLRPRFYQAVIDIQKRDKVVRIEVKEGDHLVGSQLEGYPAMYLVVKSNYVGVQMEYTWRRNARPDLNVISIEDGSRKVIAENVTNTDNIQISPKGNYLVWYDREEKQWFCHNIRRNITKSITQGIQEPFYYDIDSPVFPDAEGIAGWLNNDSAIFVYDRYDIWRLDPDGLKAPINVTDGYGREMNMRLRCLNYSKDFLLPNLIGDTLLISAFDLTTKQNGFFQTPASRSGKMSNFPMFPLTTFMYYRYTPAISGDSRPFLPIKAKNANIYLVKRMSANKYPNLYVTSDFTAFKPMSHLAPQEKYNWYTSELVHWKLPSGKHSDGILYKPENFDTNRKYPIIFFYYEKSADALNAFIGPSLSAGPLNIPRFVSNEYLVFVPDIQYTTGNPGENAYQSVMSAVKYLSQRPYIDTQRMGLQGHSFGGFETNYIVTRTSVFAAAMSAAGPTNAVSGAGQIANGSGRHEYFELRQGNIGATLWEKPELYVESTPVFKAHQVNTPILLLQNQLDGMVPPEQGLQWFTALRRLGKKAWLIQYEDDLHSLLIPKNQLDYSIRLAEFFDHYLKGKPAPEWMRGAE